ncbi:Uncharacterized protein FWK35_00020907 [Aphis craccivora]|uniref:Uncharacterized protein n=1 Tax=Aphis craccivora TaxID=307492 RepID=A0A6G0YG89_APHCR|nr:Uncharacterized protein FWK35_00020907 [Aphis craccivora]
MFQFRTLRVVSVSKMNLVGALGRSFFEFPNSFQKRWEKPKKNLYQCYLYTVKFSNNFDFF